MASTYSNLKIQLMATGENSTTWGNVCNVNLGTAIEEAITGSADVTFASGNVTLTLTDTNATQTARNLRLNLTGTTGGARNLIVPAIEKLYLVNNGCADAVTVKNASGTGVAVPAGKTMWVYNNATNVVDVVNYLTALTLGTPLAAAQGGTGLTALGSGVATWLGTPTSANLAAAVSDETGSGALVFATSPALTTPNLGTPSALVLTNATGTPAALVLTNATGTPASLGLGNATGLSLTTGVSGVLPIANGGTSITSFGAGVATWLGTPSSANLAGAVTDETGSGALVFATSPTLAGTPLAPTAANGTSTTQIATTQFVANAVASATTGVSSFNSRTGAVTLQSSDVTGALGFTPGQGTATSVGGTGTVNGITLTGTVTTSGSLTLGGTLSGVSLTSQVTGTLPVANGGTAATDATTARTNLATSGKLAFVAEGSLETNTGKISHGTSAPGTLDNSEIYFRYA